MDERRWGAVRKGMIDDGTAETEDMSDRRDRSLPLPLVPLVVSSALHSFQS